MIRRVWAQFFREVDVLICPAATTAALPQSEDATVRIDEIEINGQMQPLSRQMFWAGLASVANLPATVVPAGLCPNGLPIGIQLIGPLFEDHTCIAFAHYLEQEVCGFTAPPGCL